jgi:membrane-bound lytic murein transglycosylase D
MTMTPALAARLDPVAAARGAARYLKTAFDELGSWPLAITSYNHGIEGMRAARDRYGLDFDKVLDEYDGRTFGFASKNFYKEFLAAREVVSNQAAYFPEGIVPEAPLDHDRVTIEQPTSASGVASRFGIPLHELTELNPAWTSRAIRGSSLLPAGTEVWLPKGTLARLAANRTGDGKKSHRTAKTAEVASTALPGAP